MVIHRCKDYSEISATAARWLMERIRKNPKSNIGIATGSSPLGIYRYIAKAKNLHTSSLSLFQLDEWVGITEFQNSCLHYIEKEVRTPWGIPPDRTHYFSPHHGVLANKVQAEAAAHFYQNKLDEKGPLDILILGIGQNGHLGFIEPDNNWAPEECFLAQLSPSTQMHSMVFNEPAPPLFGVTLGLRSIMEAKEILFIAAGTKKSAVFYRWLKKEITPELPASILWKHPSVFTFTNL